MLPSWNKDIIIIIVHKSSIGAQYVSSSNIKKIPFVVSFTIAFVRDDGFK